jgi:broad specificity phosphatase PhoE
MSTHSRDDMRLGAVGTTRFFIFARHAESAANSAHVVSSDPAHDGGLTALGERQASILGDQLSLLHIDQAVCTRFRRTRRTIEIALRDRKTPVCVEPDLDEVNAGMFDGVAISSYWSWKEHHRSGDAFPGGESLDAGMRRYAAALRRLLELDHQVTLIVCHELALRSIVGAAAEIGHATPYLFDERGVSRAIDRLETLLAQHERERRVRELAA